MFGYSSSVTPKPQYEDFTQTWQYIADPLLGSSCYQTGFSGSLTIINRYVETNYHTLRCLLTRLPLLMAVFSSECLRLS